MANRLPTGCRRLEDGRIRVRVTRQHPITQVRIQRQTTLRPEASKAECLEALQALTQDCDAAVHKAITVHSPTQSLQSFVLQRIEDAARRGEWSDRTTDRYVRELSRYILPDLGQVPIEWLHGRLLQTWVDSLATKRRPDGKRYSRESIRGWVATMRRFVRDARADFELPDPTARLSLGGIPPTESRRERRTPTDSERRQLLEALQERSHYYRVAYVLAHTGLRSSEARELRGRDLDLSGKVPMLRITRSAATDTVRQPKTAAGRRSIALPKHVVDVIGGPFGDDELLFPGPKGDRLSRSGLYRALQNQCDRLGLDITIGPQVFRRDVNTRLVAAGTEGPVLRSMIGHSSVAMTGHYLGDAAEAKAAAVDRAFEGAEVIDFRPSVWSVGVTDDSEPTSETEEG